MTMTSTTNPSTWPDGTHRSQGNAFAVLAQPRAQPKPFQGKAPRRVGAKHGKALPFSLQGTRPRTR
jgi:hypothetical protein